MFAENREFINKVNETLIRINETVAHCEEKIKNQPWRSRNEK
jgi:hypothetical protein